METNPEYIKLKAEITVVHQRVQSFRDQAKAAQRKAEAQLVLVKDFEQKAEKEQSLLEYKKAQLADLKGQPPPRRPNRRGKCDAPCGKARFDSRDDANRGRKVCGSRLRAYYSQHCRCWHLTSEVY